MEILDHILQKFEKRCQIKVKEIYQSDPYSYKSSKEMIEYFKYVLPEYWEYGKKELEGLLKTAKFPIKINEGYYLYNITR